MKIAKENCTYDGESAMYGETVTIRLPNGELALLALEFQRCAMERDATVEIHIPNIWDGEKKLFPETTIRFR